ncbi:MAG: RNA pseudouridine synthase, partial [Actinomycetia bacterium]|nr:RNA pseudouridine synthase [Actinomycetes bacterium]
METKKSNKVISLISEKENIRLDKLLSELDEIPSRSYAEKLINSGNVKVNGELKPKHYLIKKRDEIVVTIPEVQESIVRPVDIKITIIYEDNSIVV